MKKREIKKTQKERFSDGERKEKERYRARVIVSYIPIV